MKKQIFTLFVGLFGLLPVIGAFGQGFTGPSGAATPGQVQTVTVAEAKNLPDNTLVKLTGSIVQAVRGDKYTFRDSSGDITIEIDRDLWALLGFSVGANDRVEIGGELDIERRNTEIDVKILRKL